MRLGFCRLFFLILLSFSFVASAASYQLYVDENGDLYLKAPNQVVVLPNKKATPIQVPAPNAYIKLVERAGQWHIELLTRAQWDEQHLRAADDLADELRLDDFDGDGTLELFLALNRPAGTQLLLRNLSGDVKVESAYYGSVELTGGIAQDKPVFSTFAAVNTVNTPGASAGGFGVDESGAATYTMPLNLPEGIAGVKPQLAFSYSSSGGDGVMGAGWSLSGSSGIARCPQNLSTDNLQGNVNFSASDRLCLNGQRLIKNGAANDKSVSDATYWNLSSQYHTELDSFVLVRQHGTAVQGPRAFTVENKAGEIHYYGDVSAVSGTDTMGKALAISLKNVAGTAEASEDAFFDTASGSNLARLWALKAIKDVKGNYILFKYTEDHALGEHYLTEVHYTGRNGGAAPFAKVVMNYVDNTKIAVGWQSQKRVAMTRLLDTVDVYQDNSIYRQYRLSYFNSNVLEEKNYLLSVQECAGSSANQCMAPTTFDWNRPAIVSTTYVTRCDNEPGVPQYCWQEPVTDSYSPFTTAAQTRGTSVDRFYQKVMDINGDGFSDLVYPRDGSWRGRLGGGTGWSSTCTTPAGEPTQCPALPGMGAFATEQTLSSVGVTKKQYAQTIDYNGDGQRDLLVANAANQSWVILSYLPASPAAPACASHGTQALCPSQTISPSFQMVSVGLLATGLEGGAMVADYDGDGLEDIVFVSGNTFQAYRNKGTNASHVHQGFEHMTNLGHVGGTSSQFGMDLTLYTADNKSASAVDVNGDGRTDLLIRVTEGQCSNPLYGIGDCLYEGYQWSEVTTLKLYASTGTGYVERQIMDDHANVRAVDLNGDGYTDLMYQLGSAWYYRLSDGQQFLTSRSANMGSAQNLSSYAYFLDLNADGRTDMLLPTSTSHWAIMLSRPTKVHEQVLFEQRGSRTFDSGAAIQFADIDADGKLDLLTATNDSGWKIYLNQRPHIKDHSLRKITTGSGVSTVIEYQAIANSASYYRQSSSNLLDSDYFSPRSGMFVVSKVSTESNSGSFVSVGYQYGGLLLHKKGRGLLGFETLRTTDNQSGVVTETLYNQFWPYTGIPKSTVQKRGSLTLSSATNTVAQQSTAYGGVLPYISLSAEQSYALNSALSQSTQLSATSSSFVYDNYGNLSSSVVTQTDPLNSANKLQTDTSNTFNASIAYQRYGRLTASTVRKRLYVNNSVTSDISRQSSFSYNADYLLETEVFAPNLAAAKSTTTYGYDAAGNKTSVAVNAGTNDTGLVTATRTSSSTYSGNFRFVASSMDAAGKTSNYFYNGVTASSFTPTLITSIKVVDPNNQSSTTNFDAFGQSTSSSVKGALSGDMDVTGSVSRSFCSGCDSLFPDAYIKVVTSSVTGAEQQQFINKYGREVGTKTKLPLSTGYSVTRKTYDSQGRLSQSFEPATNSVSTYKSTVAYDALGRVSQTTAANGGVHNLSYSGYSSTSTDALNKTRTVLSNYLGQEQSVTDHNGTILSYSYNAYGDVLTASSGSVTRVSNSYDAYGRKTAMTDVDKGSWSYKTNGFGELVSQTNAKSETTVFEYNVLGQMTRRYDPGGTVCWSYGSSAASYNINQLTAVRQWTASKHGLRQCKPHLYRKL